MDIVSYEPPRWLTRLRIHNHDCPQFSFYIEPQLLNIHHLTENEHTYIDLSTVLGGQSICRPQHAPQIHLESKEQGQNKAFGHVFLVFQ